MPLRPLIPRDLLQRIARVPACAALCSALAALGCDTRGDAQLWGNEMSPTQLQKADAGPGPMEMADPGDGESEDPFTNNPGYPYVEEPWEDPADSASE